MYHGIDNGMTDAMNMVTTVVTILIPVRIGNIVEGFLIMSILM